VLREQGLHEAASEVESFTRANRRILAELEEAHVKAVYGPFEYSPSQASALLRASERLVRMLERVERLAFGEAD
jgi:hypothetical protein